MYIDTHCHLNFKAFDQDWQDVLKESLREHVELIIVGTDRVTSEKAVVMASKYSGVWATVGFHPIHVADRDWRSEVQHIRALAKEKKVVAIGEVGLDYYRLPTTPADVGKDTLAGEKMKQEQAIVFRFFLDIAAEVQKPLMLHCREAEEDFLKLFSSVISSKTGEREIPGYKISSNKYQITNKIQNPNFKNTKITSDRRTSNQKTSRSVGQWHCFGGTLGQADKALKLGLNLGFTGLITYNNQWDEIIRELPIDRILAETDAPYLTPHPYRGQRNEPKYIKEVVKRIAELKSLSVEEIEQQTYRNAGLLYKSNS